MHIILLHPSFYPSSTTITFTLEYSSPACFNTTKFVYQPLGNIEVSEDVVGEELEKRLMNHNQRKEEINETEKID